MLKITPEPILYSSLEIACAREGLHYAAVREQVDKLYDVAANGGFAGMMAAQTLSIYAASLRAGETIACLYRNAIAEAQ